ncbi:phosphatase PAP2 family protein [Acidimangrovimonas sediminis]|uniref:phosphatase PAP2 family protein n=1 Tax=Acidimangrovimonas sediminis TaxID=2056283 RepID=UPI001E439446|nr:phosphatase PAP2 family protein [Acidimangrovimonas sediminis]
MLLGLVAAHFFLTLIAGRIAGVPFHPGTLAALAQIFYMLLPVFLTGAVVLRFLRMARYVRPAHPVAWFLQDLRALATAPGRAADGVLALIALSVFTGTFSYFKELIPHLAPFSWDTTFSHWDKLLHFGVLPQTLLLHAFGNAYVISVLNAVYQGWFFVMFLMIFVAVFSTADRASRNTFLVGFVLAWGIGGNVIATLLSSAGPCYYDRLGFGHAYDGLMSTLQAYNRIAPNWSLRVQEMLWDGYLGHGGVRGISAMPSMHVASTTVLMLYGWRRGRNVGRWLTLFWALICTSAVILGWHYAIDVYAGFACGLAAWWGAARLTGDRAFTRRSRVPDQDPAQAPGQAPAK